MRILVTGGSASGKSALAEQFTVQCAPGGRRLYLAAMQPFGEDAQFRIARHKKLRAGKDFDTVERYTDYAHFVPPMGYGAALFECVSNALANELFSPDGAGENWKDSILSGVDALAAACPHVVVVTNEVFSDGRTYDAGTMAYLRALGQLNQLLAQRADVVIESVCGIPVMRKGSADFE